MLRKLFGGLILLGVGSYLWFGTSAGSYSRTAYAQTVGYFKGQVPLEFELQRAKDLVNRLDPDITRTAKDIVIEEVRLARLQDEIVRAEKDQAEQEVVIKALRDNLKSGLAIYKIAGRNVDRGDLERELNRKFRTFKRVSDNLDQRRDLFAARQSKLIVARDAYQGLLETKKELQSQIEDLDSQHKIQLAKKVACRMDVNAARFNEARQAIDELKERLAVDQKLLEQDGFMSDPLPVEDLAPANLTDEIDAYFQNPVDQGTSA